MAFSGVVGGVDVFEKKSCLQTSAELALLETHLVLCWGVPAASGRATLSVIAVKQQFAQTERLGIESVVTEKLRCVRRSADQTPA